MSVLDDRTHTINNIKYKTNDRRRENDLLMTDSLSNSTTTQDRLTWSFNAWRFIRSSLSRNTGPKVFSKADLKTRASILTNQEHKSTKRRQSTPLGLG